MTIEQLVSNLKTHLAFTKDVEICEMFGMSVSHENALTRVDDYIDTLSNSELLYALVSCENL